MKVGDRIFFTDANGNERTGTITAINGSTVTIDAGRLGTIQRNIGEIRK